MLKRDELASRCLSVGCSSIYITFITYKYVAQSCYKCDNFDRIVKFGSKVTYIAHSTLVEISCLQNCLTDLNQIWYKT